MTWLKQSTAATVKLGPFVDSTDGVTAETGLTISQADIRLTKNGGAFAQTNNAAGATHDENGYYGVPLNTTDTGTLGRLRVAVNESGALPVWQDFLVVAANVYDSLVGGGDTLDVQVTGIDANAITAASIAADAITDAKVASDVTIASVTGAVGSVTGAVGSVTGLTASDVGAIKTKTDFLPSATAGAAGGLFIAGTNAATAITTALTANVIGNVTGNLSGSVGSVTGAVGSVTGAVGSVTGAVGSVATGGIAAASFAAGAIDAAAIATDAIDADALKADAVTEIQSGLSTAAALATAQGTLTKLETTWVLDGAVYQFTANALELGPSGSGLDAAGVRAAIGLASANLDTQLDALPTNAELATALGTADDAVLAAVATAQTGIDAIPTNAELATALGTADDAVLAAIAALPQDKTGYALSTAGNAAVADKILGRTLAGGADGGRMVKDALRSLRNKTSIAAGTLTVTEEDDTTVAWTAIVTTSPGDPLTSIDPA